MTIKTLMIVIYDNKIESVHVIQTFSLGETIGH